MSEIAEASVISLVSCAREGLSRHLDLSNIKNDFDNQELFDSESGWKWMRVGLLIQGDEYELYMNEAARALASELNKQPVLNAKHAAADPWSNALVQALHFFASDVPFTIYLNPTTHGMQVLLCCQWKH